MPSLFHLRRTLKDFRRTFGDPVLAVGLIIAVLFVVITILLPIFSMVSAGLSGEGLTNLQRFIGDPVYLTIIRNTIVMGLTVAVAGTLLGFLFAYVQVKVKVPFKRFMHVIALIPIISPPFALASAIIILFGRNGLVTKGIFDTRCLWGEGRGCNDIYGLDGLTLVLSLSLFTVAYMNLKGMLEALDPALDEAATNLGGSKWHIFRTVTVPMLVPGLAGSFLLLFVEAIADLGNPLVLGGNYEVLATRIYISIVGLFDTNASAALSVILLIPSLTVFLVQRYWISRASVVSVTGKPTGKPQQIEHPVVRWTLFAVVMAVCVLIVAIYGTIFVGAFTEVLGVNNTFTLSHFDFVINGYGAEAMTDTTLLSVVATPIAGLMGIFIAFLVVRKPFPGRGALDFATMLGIALPGTILGIGYLIVFNNPIELTIPIGETPLVIPLIPKLTGGRALLGGALAIILVYIVRSVPAALRSGVSLLSQIDPAIEEASTSLGANNAQTFRRITLPLIRPAFLSGLMYAFARSMTTISAIVFLTTPQTKIMTAQILNEVENGRFGNAFAYCVILILIVIFTIGVLTYVVGGSSAATRGLQGGR
ncbi:MAG: iron ABC transporter permease [Anaerolineae bacterium]|nr:iron ABC transporter permease [Anaerolineae bacterium]